MSPILLQPGNQLLHVQRYPVGTLAKNFWERVA